MPPESPSPLRLIHSAPRAGGNLLEAALPRARLTEDPASALLDMRLVGNLRAFLVREGPRYGLTVEDAVAKDHYTPIERSYTAVRGQNLNLGFLHVPEWIVGNGTNIAQLEMIRSAFGGRLLRIVSEELEQATLGLDLMLENWRQRDAIEGRFISWRHIKEMLAGTWGLAQVLGLELVEVERPPAPIAAVAPPARHNPVFISYSHKDRRSLNSLLTQLKPLVRKGEFKVWSDKEIAKGEKWQDAIEQALAAAKVAVLLVSAEFLASDFIAEKELPPLLQAAEAKGLKILWVYLSECNYEETEIGRYQAAHAPLEPLEGMARAERNRVLKEISQEIGKAALGE